MTPEELADDYRRSLDGYYDRLYEAGYCVCVCVELPDFSFTIPGTRGQVGCPECGKPVPFLGRPIYIDEVEDRQ